jgi:hypothetical protein
MTDFRSKFPTRLPDGARLSSLVGGQVAAQQRSFKLTGTQTIGLAILASALAVCSSSLALAAPIQIPPLEPGALEYRCAQQGGHFEMHSDGSYLCRFRNGTTISCDPDGLCIQFMRTPNGSPGALNLEQRNTGILTR